MFKSLCSKSYILLKKTFNFFFSYSGTINSGDFWISMILLSYLGQILERYNIYNIILCCNETTNYKFIFKNLNETSFKFSILQLGDFFISSFKVKLVGSLIKRKSCLNNERRDSKREKPRS